MFSWLYGSNASSPLPREQQPLVIWTNGGPGAGSSGYGNFDEMGPLDLNLQPRNTSWIYSGNLLFVDQPVGSGFSYVDDPSLYVTDNAQIAADLVSFWKIFSTANPWAQTVPLFIFCESYGGKMTVQFATALLAAVAAGETKANLRGVALGDSWISPIDYVDTWGPFLRATSLMDSSELATLNREAVGPCDAAVAAGQWANATNLWADVENYVSGFSCADFYDIRKVDCGSGKNAQPPTGRGLISDADFALAPEGIRRDALQSLFTRHVARTLKDPIADLMNGPVRQKLGIIPANVSWGGQSGAVFSALSGDFMRPVIDVLDGLLTGGQINVTIYEGSVDLICGTMGAELWMTRMQWSGMPNFYASTKQPVSPYAGAPTGAFRRTYGNLGLWYVLQAGHMVPADQGAMALTMIQTILAEQA
jgi:serine carboxypeptidase 1